MKPFKNRTSLAAVLSVCVLLIIGCNYNNAAKSSQKQHTNNDIVILFTNDVHCGIDGSIGYAGLADCKNKMLKKTPYVALVDCGDAVQGAVTGMLSKGEYIINIMNRAGYDYAILGNHEFDYGLKRIAELMDAACFKYLGCNISYTGSGRNELGKLLPYDIANYGDKSVAFIGVSTPYSIISSAPKYFADDEGNIVYDFGNKSKDKFYAIVQRYADECRNKGADYVILLAHLGDTDAYSPYSSTELISNTNGIDAVLDGHAHNKIPNGKIPNKDGEDVILASAGTNLETIGELVITDNGLLVSTNINPYSGKDKDMARFIEKIKNVSDKELNRVIALSDTKLSCCDDAGLRIVRNRETTIGNFCADAVRWVLDSDIAIINGGGIRADLPGGDIAYADIINVFPYGDMLCKAEATGQEIADALEFGSRNTVKNYAQNGTTIGENGGFFQVSGLKYTVNTQIPPAIATDINGAFLSVDGQRRVKNIEVMDANGNYSPIDLNKTYTVASNHYILKDGGDGCSIFTDNVYLTEDAMTDYQALISYINEELKGNLSRYGSTEGRIIIE